METPDLASILGTVKRERETRASRSRTFTTLALAAACIAGLSVRLPSLMRSVEIEPAAVSAVAPSPNASSAGLDEEGAVCTGAAGTCGGRGQSETGPLASADLPACLAQPSSLASLPQPDRLACESEEICSIARP
jgi:hypothetical protein